jgi:hypothetical protein
MSVSRGTLKILAALVWYVGAAALLAKALDLLGTARALDPRPATTSVVLALGIIIGATKALFLFLPACQRNLRRIDHLREPRIWQFYRPRFFVFLALMVSLGMWLSRIAEGRYPVLLGVALLDVSLATALLLGSRGFWRSHQAS